jgi:hypothetical protein
MGKGLNCLFIIVIMQKPTLDRMTYQRTSDLMVDGLMTMVLKPEAIGNTSKNLLLVTKNPDFSIL